LTKLVLGDNFGGRRTNAKSHKAANSIARSRRPYALSRLMPAASAALVTLRVRASMSRKLSWRSAVQPSRRIL
jgi:hypothetical protein